MKKGSLKWYNNLAEEYKIEIFKRWRRITSDNRKHWCFNDIKKNENIIKIMLQEVKTNITGKEDLSRLNDLGISWKYKVNI